MTARPVHLPVDDVASLEDALKALARIFPIIEQSDDPDYLHDLADQAALLVEMQRIRNLADELAWAALRVSVLAWRRIGLLGAKVGTASERHTANTLARLSVEEIDDFLADFTGRSAGGFAKIVAARLREREAVDDVRAGRSPSPSFHSALERSRRDSANLHQAAQEVLRAIERRGDGDWTTTGAALSLLAALDVPVDSLTVCAAREVVREAMAAADPSDGSVRRDALRYLPRFVSFLSDADEWVRIPVEVATVAQVRWMADYRRNQARDLLRRADELNLAATALEEAASDPDSDLVKHHWSRKMGVA